MPQTYTVNPNQTKPIDRPVSTIEVSVGSATVIVPASQKLPDDESKTQVPEETQDTSYTLNAGDDALELHGQGGINVFSSSGASVTVVYEDELIKNRRPGEQDTVSPEATAGHEKGASRGDSDPDGDPEGGSGSFESRTLKELRQTAKERGLTGVSKLNKDDLIARLRGE